MFLFWNAFYVHGLIKKQGQKIHSLDMMVEAKAMKISRKNIKDEKDSDWRKDEEERIK
jgi:hypothetical protein